MKATANFQTTHKPVLVTGGAGFVGGHFVNLLSRLSIHSIVIDDLSTGHRDNLPSDPSRYTFIQADINDAADIPELVHQAGLVVHMAAVVGMKHVTENPLKTLRTNVDAVRRLAELCVRARVPLVYISSSAVYRCSESLPDSPFSESVQVHPTGFHPASIYAESKALCELICEMYCRTQGLKCLIIRPFNLIGPRQASAYGMVVPKFVRNALAGIPLPVHGDGSQRRTFSDVRQAIDLLWKVICLTSWDCQTVNLATNDQPVSILHLARLVSDIIGCVPRYEFVDHQSEYGRGFVDVRTRRPALDVLQQLVGSWSPVSLADSIATIVEYESKRIVAPREVVR